MPKDFDNCRAMGGKITTKVIEPGEKYMHICWLNGKSYGGDVKTYNKLTQKKNAGTK